MKLVNESFVAPKANYVFDDPIVKVDMSNDKFTVYHVNYFVDGYNLLGLHFKIIIFNSDISSNIDGFMMYPDMPEHEPGAQMFEKGTEQQVIEEVIDDVEGDFSNLSANISTNRDMILSDLLDPSHKTAKAVKRIVERIQGKLVEVFK